MQCAKTGVINRNVNMRGKLASELTMPSPVLSGVMSAVAHWLARKLRDELDSIGIIILFATVSDKGNVD